MIERVAVLQRLQESNHGTFGVLRTPLGFKALSIELPWRENRSNISCIPPGEYKMIWTYSPTFKRMMYIALGTSPRSGIRLHPGNLAGDVLQGLRSHFKGCIGLGARTGVLSGQRAVLTSAPVVAAFQNHMEMKPFKLVIQ